MNHNRSFVVIATTLILAIVLASCGAGRRSVATDAKTNDTTVLDYPVVDLYSPGRTLDVRRIVLTDSSTTIHFSAKFRPKYWIRIDTSSYIVAKDGEKLRMKGYSGCLTPGKKHFMPENGRDSFALVFPPVPKGTKSIDFIESEAKDGFKLFGIDLTDRQTVRQFKELPDELKTFPDRNTPLPDPQFTAGKTTVVFHYPAGSERLVKSVNLVVNRLLQQRLDMEQEIDTLTHTATFTFDICGPSSAFTFTTKVETLLLLTPGETVNVYVNPFSDAVRVRNTHFPNHKLQTVSKIHADGYYAAFNNYANNERLRNPPSMDVWYSDLTDYKASDEEYVRKIKEKYRKIMSDLESKDIPLSVKEYYEYQIKNETVMAFGNAYYLRKRNYRTVHKVKDGDIPFKFTNLPPALLSEIDSLFDMTDPRLLEGGNAEYLIYGVNDSDSDWESVLGDRGKLLYDLKDADLVYIPRIKAGSMTEEELKGITSNCHPLAAAILESMYSELAEARKIDSHKFGFKDTPECPGDKLFDEIIAPYKGKIVLVDFWNTWCGPCAMAMNAIEPYKSKELNSDEIVWLYIANTTSPYAEYQKRIQDIKGVHYRLSKEQWDEIAHNKFKIYGIPAYVLVHKDGTYEFREDFLFHGNLISTLKSML